MTPPKEKQEEILKQFREQLEQRDLIHESDTIGTDDATLLRFLRARQFDLKAATTMWENCHNWRKTVEGIGIDELYRRLDPYNYPERAAVFECWPLWFHKTDKKGRPLNIHHFGGINMPELYKHVTPERFWQTIIVNAESLTREVLPASARAAGHQIDGTFVIVDLKGFGLSQFWQMKNLARDSFQISQDYFPETMAQLAIINAPSSFTTIWGFIKPWLAKETLAKIDILGSDYQDILLQQIPADNLPESLGGTCTCAEAGGCKLSNAGPWMHNRKERREGWLRGERKYIGLGEDEDDGVRGMESEHQTKAAVSQLGNQSEEASKLAAEKQSERAPKEQPADVPPVVVQNAEERQRSFVVPEPAVPVRPAPSYEKTTDVIADQDTKLKPALPPALTPSASGSSSSSTSSSSFQSARSSFGSTDTLGSEGAHNAKTGTSVVMGTSTATTETGVSKDSEGRPKHVGIRQKLKKPLEKLEKLGLGNVRGHTSSEGSASFPVLSALSRGTSADGSKSLFRKTRSRRPSAEVVDEAEETSRKSSLDVRTSPTNVNGSASAALTPASTSSPVGVESAEPPLTALSSENVKSVQDVYENHPETRQPQMGDSVQA